jgi:hypothetical protein
MLTILDTVRDSKLFRPWFRVWESWRPWRVVLKPIFGLPMSEEDLAIFYRPTSWPPASAERSWF